MNPLACVLTALHFVGILLTGAATYCSAESGFAGWSMDGCWCEEHEHGDAAPVDDHGDCGETDPGTHPECGACRHSVAAPPVGLPLVIPGVPALAEGAAGVAVEPHPPVQSGAPVRSAAPVALLLQLRC